MYYNNANLYITATGMYVLCMYVRICVFYIYIYIYIHTYIYIYIYIQTHTYKDRYMMDYQLMKNACG